MLGGNLGSPLYGDVSVMRHTVELNSNTVCCPFIVSPRFAAAGPAIGTKFHVEPKWDGGT